MTILADWEIRELCQVHEEPYNPTREEYEKWKALPAPMISPFDAGEKKPGRISSGLSSYGYDIRLGTKFKVFTNIYGGVIDPMNKEPNHFFGIEVEKDGYLDIPPTSFALAESVERFCMPADVTGIVLGKSTYARCALIVNCTPIEGGWEGILTIELTNPSPLPLRLRCGHGIAQVLFFRGKPCQRPYGLRSGTYQGQTGLTLAKVAQ